MNIMKIGSVSLLALSLAACSAVPSGHVGVKVNLYGSDKGVDNVELGPGRYWIGFYEELHIFPTFTQNYCWTKGVDLNCNSESDEAIVFQTAEGLSVSADVGISYAIEPDKVSQIFQRYRKGVKEITDIYLRNIVRDAIVTASSWRSVEDVYGKGKVEIMLEVEKQVKSVVGPIGIKVENIYWIGDIRLPEKVIESLNAKIAATQMAQQRQNEVAQAKAEADKKIEEARGQANSIILVAKSQAEANKILAESLTPEFLMYSGITRWDGQLPKITGGATPLIGMNENGLFARSSENSDK